MAWEVEPLDDLPLNPSQSYFYMNRIQWDNFRNYQSYCIIWNGFPCKADKIYICLPLWARLEKEKLHGSIASERERESYDPNVS